MGHSWRFTAPHPRLECFPLRHDRAENAKFVRDAGLWFGQYGEFRAFDVDTGNIRRDTNPGDFSSGPP